VVRSRSVLVTFGPLTATLTAGYGVLFSMLDAYRDEYGIGEGALGTVMGVGFFAGFVSQVLIAPYADRGHARKLVLGGMLMNLLGVVMMALATSVVPLMAGRVVTGIGIGMAMPAVRRIVILSEPDRIGNNLGRLLSIDVAGFAMGPVISAVLVGPFGIPAPFFVISAISLLLLPSVWRVRVAETTGADIPTQRMAFDLLKIRPFLGAIALGSAIWVMIGSFDSLWVIAMRDLDASRWMANIGITIFALPLVIFAAAGGRLAQRVGPFKVSSVGLGVAAVAMLLYGQVPTAIAMFVVAFLHSISDGFTMASVGVGVGMVVPAGRQAGAQGMLGGAQVLTAGISATSVGYIYQYFGRAAAYGVAALAIATLLAVGVALLGSAYRVAGTPGVSASPSPHASASS
jgi:MFS family permease